MRAIKLFQIGFCLAMTLVLGLAAEQPERFKVSEFTFERPDAWDWVKTTSAMRAAELKVEDELGQAEVVFFYFGPGSGGGTQANVDRWFRQFQEPRAELNPEVEEKNVKGTKVTYVKAEGTYLSGIPGGTQTPLKDHKLLGAIIEGKAGHVFIRMTGPIPLVTKVEEDFRKMVESGP